MAEWLEQLNRGRGIAGSSLRTDDVSVYERKQQHLSSMRLQQILVVEFRWLFRHNFLSLFPPASNSSPATEWRPVQVEDLYDDETEKTGPYVPGIVRKEKFHTH